jgi:hypothetical protein
VGDVENGSSTGTTGDDSETLASGFAPEPLRLRFGGSLVEQLGAQLYPSVTATIAELISNAWDADADNVWVTVPLATAWEPQAEVIVVDDGHGMTRQGAQDTYLVVGRRRRNGPLKDKSENGRRVHGRKGIGKLAAFGTAGRLECTTLRDGAVTAFALDYDSIRRLSPDTDYTVEHLTDVSPPAHPDGTELGSGTRVVLSQLRVKRQLNEATFINSMSRRFAIKGMNVFINENRLERFHIPLEYRFPKDGVPNDDITQDDEGWAIEWFSNGNEVRWWFGFTETPLQEGDQQGISVLARDKMAQRPFKFDRAQGTTAQLGQEYLVGEVVADWIDDGVDIESDLIQSNRDQLQLEDPRLDELMEWGRRRLSWALRERQKLKAKKAADDAEKNPDLEKILEGFTKNERRNLLIVAGRLSKLPEMDAANVTDVMRGIVDSRSEVVVRDLMDRIADEDDPVQDRMWSLVAEFGLIDARRLKSVIEARLKTIARLTEAIVTGAKEVPDIHNLVREDTWLLDPRWHLLGHEIDVMALPGVNFVPESDEETGNQLDFLFALAPTSPAPKDQVVVVEIKRGSHSTGRVRKADLPEVNKFHQYVLAVQQHYEKSTKAPVVRGLMIAQDYTAGADGMRKNLEQIISPKLEFKTWDRVLDETHRMHLGWLEVSEQRAKRRES